MSKNVYIITFPSTHYAVSAEKKAKTANVSIKMIPVPRAISSDCNMGMETSIENGEVLKSLFPSENIECEFVLWNK